MDGHPEKCQCKNCIERFKMVVESWRLQNKRDRAEKLGDQAEIDKSNKRLMEIGFEFSNRSE